MSHASHTKQIKIQESRAGVMLRKYWESLKGNRDFPTEDEIDPDAIEGIWDSCFLISIDDVMHRLGYRYSYLGTKLIEAYGDDINNPEIVLNLLSTDNHTNMRLVANFDQVLSLKQPVFDEAGFVNLKHMNVRYRLSLFPLGIGEEVLHILGCMRWRVY